MIRGPVATTVWRSQSSFTKFTSLPLIINLYSVWILADVDSGVGAITSMAIKWCNGCPRGNVIANDLCTFVPTACFTKYPIVIIIFENLLHTRSALSIIYYFSDIFSNMRQRYAVTRHAKHTRNTFVNMLEGIFGQKIIKPFIHEFR